jgi:hypothetical protein
VVVRFRGVFLAAAATALVVIVEFPPWANEEVAAPTTGCDPSCGIGTVGFLIFILPVVMVRTTNHLEDATPASTLGPAVRRVW